jgi:uncharacterized OB-fold protein
MSDHHLIPSRITIPFSYTAGRVASRFFVELRDNKRIMAVRCPACKRVLVPPQLVCVECYEKTEDWIEVGPEGELINYTVVMQPEAHYPVEAPFVVGIIRLDGADTYFLHHIGEPQERLSIGARVVAQFADERVGSIWDISCFKVKE